TSATGTMQPCTITTTGQSHDITGATTNVTRTISKCYDSYGRLLEENGPLPDASALDKTSYAYYPTYDSSHPYNFGRLQSVTRYVGTSSSSTSLVTTYSDYDLFGVASTVTAPNGDKVTYSASTDRLTWTLTQVGSDGSTVGASLIVLNGDGTVQS